MRKFPVKNGTRWLSWSVSVAVAIGLLVNIPGSVIGQSQPLQSAEQLAALKEAEGLNQQAFQLLNEGKYSQGIPLAERGLAIFEKVLGNVHPLVAASLNNLAELYKAKGNYQKAEPLLQRSLAILEKALGREHPSVATSLNNLASLYQTQGNYQKAEPLYQRSLAIDEKALGNVHPLVAIDLNNLAGLYAVQGNYQKAEPLYQRSLTIRERVLGKEHPSVATSLDGLAGLYRLEGNYQKAELLLQRSLAILEKALGKESPSVATSLNSLALLYQTQGNYQKAEPLYQRSLAIREKVLGNIHPDVAQSLNNLAALYQAQGNYQKAELLYQGSLAIVEKALGNVHPDVAQILNNLAELYEAQGNYQKAEPLLQRSLAIVEKALGNVHPLIASIFGNLASLYWSKGDITHATDFYSSKLTVEDNNLALLFAVGSEQRKQDYAKTFTGGTDRLISLSQQQGVNNINLAHLALTTVLRRKGLVLDAVSDSIQTLRSQLASQPKTQKLFDEWLSVQQQQSALVYRGQGKQSATDYQAQYQQLEVEKERLEEAISTKSAEFRNATQPVELQAIQAHIPLDAALVEIVQYEPFNPKAKQLSQQWGKPHYAAAVLHSEGEPKWVNLGDAATIDKSVANFRTALQNRLLPVDFEARKLYDQLMAPIRPLLGNARHVLLSPDGQLTLIPFEALKNEQGQYLIQRYSFSYLTTGRDLLRFQSPASSRSAPVVLADIDYDKAQTVAAISKSTNSVDGSQNRRSVDFANLKVPSLTATKLEAAAIKKTLPNANVLLGALASETAVKQLHGPSILHLATHAFFFPDLELDLKPSLESGLGQKTPKALQLENPLLRSGLALAGFNKRFDAPASSDDGVLTSLEVAGLDLRGTQLVVLSACETGLGDVKVGDGLYGLRRALVIAGSQSQVLSLWEVDDAGTKDLMEIYYQGLKAGKGRHQALQDAQLKLLSNPNYQHPYYWASFVASGDWTPLQMGH